ncbi:MAG: 50S ribosomal protein L11 methyltransferase [Leptospira sp.]|nr:50S ribosomal protein L11 methyltransferase [Leptospira sp.]
MKYIEAKISIDKDFSQELDEFLDSLQLPGYYEVLFDSSEPKEEETILKTNTIIRAYLNPEDVDKELKIRIFLKSLCPDSHELEIREIETREYEEAYKEFYKPFQLGNLWVVPIWERENPQVQALISKDHIPLYLNPGVAFGTGHHETTQLILELLPNILSPKSKILDLGTGSGILSLACGLLGASRIFSVDIDPNAVQAAQSNWKENTYPNPCQFEAEVGGLDHPKIFTEEYDLVLANITFAVLSQNIKHIARVNSSHFLFSGVITERKDEFLELLANEIPGALVSIQDRNGWERIEWKRKTD